MIEIHPLRVQKNKFINYCYIVNSIQTKAALLIDPAWQPEIITATLTEKNLTPQAILLTHHHFDHIHLADYFANFYNIPVYMGNEEIHFYQFNCTNLLPIQTENSFQVDDIVIKPISTPGHTSGGLCYLIQQGLFTGDTLFNEGCGMCLGTGANPYQLFYSLEKLKRILTSNTLIYPGHCYGLPVGQTFNTVLQNNIYLQFSDIESFVNFRMRKQQSKLFNFQ